MWLSLLITVITGYLLGNLNGAVCMSALMKDDVRDHGSGNAGLTNFIRNYGGGRAVYVILIDGGKAVIACLAGGLMMQADMGWEKGAILGGLGVMLGHTFPALLGFRGGKGILSGLFVALVCDWRVALIILAVFLTAYLLTGYVSLGSVLASAAFSVGFVVFHYDEPVQMICGAAIGLLAVFMHRGNIGRLLAGQERKTNLFARKGEK